MISEGQRNDINYAIPLLDHIEIDGSKVLADRGYDSNQLIDYIYDHGGEPTIPSRRGAKFERRCDWWFYKERHLVENYFLKLKAFRRIATRYDKLAFILVKQKIKNITQRMEAKLLLKVKKFCFGGNLRTGN